MNVLFLTASLCFFMVIKSQPPPHWRPDDGRDISEFMHCRGMNCSQWDKVRTSMQEMQDMFPSNDSTTDGPILNEGIDGDPTSFGRCVWLTPEQAAVAVRNAKKFMENKKTNRQKRKILDLEAMPDSKWSNPIFYKFDGTHGDSEKEIIRAAFRHWEAQTCLIFIEVSTNSYIPIGHILVTNFNRGCYSYVGKTRLNPQMLNLADVCLSEFGIPVHEIGHALGFWHEQQRPDRDDHITVNFENIGFYQSQFLPMYGAEHHGVDYDMGSVMHYASKDASKNNQYTMEAHNPLYQKSMGQRTGLSFYDTKLVNFAYCNATCQTRLPFPCQNGGYQDPTDCGRCRCPEGLGGRYCDGVGESKSDCGGLIELQSYAPKYVQSPNYPNSYDNFDECNWMIQAPRYHRIRLTFESAFGMYAHQLTTCFHWLEVRYTRDLGRPGPRLCDYRAPKEPIISQTEKMVLAFRANYSTPWSTARRGFRARLVAEPVSGGPPTEVPTTTTRRPTTAPSTAAPTTTTPQPTTTTQSTTIQTTTVLPTTTIRITPTTTVEPRPTSPSWIWGDWSACMGHRCSCGGCSFQTRQRICDGAPCAGSLGGSQLRSCDRVCTSTDTYLIFAGRFYTRYCAECCYGYVRSGNICVSTSQDIVARPTTSQASTPNSMVNTVNRVFKTLVKSVTELFR